MKKNPDINDIAQKAIKTMIDQNLEFTFSMLSNNLRQAGHKMSEKAVNTLKKTLYQIEGQGLIKYTTSGDKYVICK